MHPKPSLHRVPQTSSGEYLGSYLYRVTTVGHLPGLCLTLTSILLSHIASLLICLHQTLICSRYSSTLLASPHLTAGITISAKSHTIAPSLDSQCLLNTFPSHLSLYEHPTSGVPSHFPQ